MYKTAKEYHEAVGYFVANPDKRLPYMEAGKKRCLKDHTYFDRVSKMLARLGMEEESQKCLTVQKNFLGAN
jgi:spore maturation protein CgeB